MARLLKIETYDSAWIERFGALAHNLRTTLGDIGEIHHIGSTAVPGLAAKPVIDIQVTVDDLSKAKLDQLDPRFQETEGAVDHQPRSVRLAARDLEKRFFRSKDGSAHIHVRTRGRYNQRYPLLFRDYLRAHPSAAMAYAAVKRALVDKDSIDRTFYYAVKDPVCDLILEAAEVWARETSWVLPPSDI